jgi:hypothetical protein
MCPIKIYPITIHENAYIFKVISGGFPRFRARMKHSGTKRTPSEHQSGGVEMVTND